ncbi:MAG: thiol reductant ABC exporter subunit CydD [Gammaproteobacteria bacterium]|nr:MAG: thiol reductant ABC exporter subunit CydD [Gammaproteobacteria bacterium]
MAKVTDSAIPAFLKAQKPLAGFCLKLSVGLGLLSGLLLIAQTWCLASIINAVIFNDATLGDVTFFLTTLLALFLLRAGLNWASEQAAVTAAMRVKRGLRQRLHQTLFDVGPLFLNNERSGELVNTVVDGVDALENYYARYLPVMSLVALLPLSILVFVFPIDWISGVILLVTAPLIPFFMIMIGKGTERLNKRQWRKLARMSAHFLDMIQGLTTLKLFNASRREAQVISRISDDYRLSTMSVLRVAFLSSLLLEFLSTVSIAMVAVLVGFRLMYGELDFFFGFFALLLAPEFYLPLRSMGTHYHAKMEAIGAAEKMLEVLEPEKVELDDGTEPLLKKTGVETMANSTSRSKFNPTTDASASIETANRIGIEFDNVCFDYAPGRPALKNVSLTIRPNENMAIVGQTGAGKSTLMNLLLGFIRPQSGTIKINDTALQTDQLEAWRKQIAWMPQRAHLFHGSVRENIALGQPDADDPKLDQAIRAAANAAQIASTIEQLPEQYDTHVGEHGVGFSGGQIQRIALARAFFKNAPVMLLDEPTAHLDLESEQLIQQSLPTLTRNRTVISIAHRLNTVKQADRIVLLDNGKVLAVGKHEKLMTEQPVYAEMVSRFQRGAR